MTVSDSDSLMTVVNDDSKLSERLGLNAASRCLSSAFRVHVSAPYFAIGITMAPTSRCLNFKKYGEARARHRLISFEELFLDVAHFLDFLAPNSDFGERVETRPHPGGVRGLEPSS